MRISSLSKQVYSTSLSIIKECHFLMKSNCFRRRVENNRIKTADLKQTNKQAEKQISNELKDTKYEN